MNDFCHYPGWRSRCSLTLGYYLCPLQGQADFGLRIWAGKKLGELTELTGLTGLGG